MEIGIDGGCARCGLGWPQVLFTKAEGAVFVGEQKYIDHVRPIKDNPRGLLCDSCLAVDEQSAQITQAMTEALDPSIPGLERRVVVTGIKSGTNITQFEYVTHRGMGALVVSDVIVHFCKNPEVLESLRSTYVFKAVPVPVLEAWFVAPSKGGFFIQFIKNSYPSEKIN